jgi:hypothetical protein
MTPRSALWPAPPTQRLTWISGSSSYAQRFAPRDAEDLYRLLEAAHVDGVTADAWPDQPTFTAAASHLSAFFDTPGRGLADAVREPEQRIRARALTRSLVGLPTRSTDLRG